MVKGRINSTMIESSNNQTDIGSSTIQKSPFLTGQTEVVLIKFSDVYKQRLYKTESDVLCIFIHDDGLDV